jgi:NAD(P)-dependent dehydrogenase (short-subunit alcohol dehydrogenase family)
MANRLKGKVAVITGGNSGIGFATAKLFQAEGAKVVITGRRQDAVEAAVKEIGRDATGIVSDAGKLDDIQALYQRVKEEVGTIDVLFLNAGVATFGPFTEVDEAVFDAMVDVNFKGLFFNVQKALPLLNSGASVIFNTSIADQKGFAETSVYSATKAAVRSLARTLSAELLEDKIRFNAIAPGPIDTPIFEKLGVPKAEVANVKEGYASRIPMKRMGSPDDIANAALFLASDDSSFIMGIDLTVDGGMAHL